MQSKAPTPDAYLAELPPDRRAALEAVRAVIRENLDDDYEEGMQYGMIGYYVPHRVYPAGYHCDPKQPLPFAGLASQKNHMSVYLMCVYGSTEHMSWFQKAWARTGKKLDMGKACIRFKKLDDLALDVLGEAVRRVPVRKFIEYYEAAIRGNTKRAAAAKAQKKSAAKPPAKPKKPDSASRKRTPASAAKLRTPEKKKAKKATRRGVR